MKTIHLAEILASTETSPAEAWHDQGFTIRCSIRRRRGRFLRRVAVLRNPQLRKNVAHAIDVIQAKRGKLVVEKTDWQALRTAGAAIRTHALENLGAYLTQFEERCTAAGAWFTGRRCRRGAADHFELAARGECFGSYQIKTMTSAEIQLNPFLEARSADLRDGSGGNHLQLGGEPSHIVVPALH